MTWVEKGDAHVDPKFHFHSRQHVNAFDVKCQGLFDKFKSQYGADPKDHQKICADVVLARASKGWTTNVDDLRLNGPNPFLAAADHPH